MADRVEVRGAGSPKALTFTAEWKGIFVADELKVDPVALHNGSNDMLDSVGEAALSFVSHEDGLAEAAPGWIGSSQQALGQLAARCVCGPSAVRSARGPSARGASAIGSDRAAARHWRW